MSKSVIVEDREELKEAQKTGAKEIIVLGSLAKALYAARIVRTMSKATFTMLAGIVGASAVTTVSSCGLSLGITVLTAGPLAGMSMDTLMIILMLGGVVWSIYHDYDFEFDASQSKLILKKRR